MTKAQAAQVQRQIDDVLRDGAPGGRQVAPNKVEWPEKGVTFTAATPGARSGRDVCPYHYACAWQHENYRGGWAQFKNYGWYRLKDWGLPPNTTLGVSSWYNHQSGGAHAELHGYTWYLPMVSSWWTMYSYNDLSINIRLYP